MKKKVLGVLLAAVMVIGLAACGNSNSGSSEKSEAPAASSAAETSSAASEGETPAASADLKIGVILVGDETEGYTMAHIEGIKKAAADLGIADSQILWKYKVEESSDCSDAAIDLVASGCNLVISNSYGHQTFMADVAADYPDVEFVSMTGDFAAADLHSLIDQYDLAVLIRLYLTGE